MANTKVILTRDVPNLGTSGDVVTVARGYARNYLLPRSMAQPWNKGAQKQIDDMVRARRRREIANVEDARAVRDQIEAAGQVIVQKRAGDGGRLFGAVSTSDIAQAVADQLKQKVDRRKIIIPEIIKKTGKFPVEVGLHADVSAKLMVRVDAI